jgi:hypothetical protein
MPSERAARDDLLAAVENIRKLISITDEIDELIPCGWLSKDEAAQLRAIQEFLFRCVLDGHPLLRTLRDAVDSLLAIFNEDREAAVLWEDHRIARAREVLKESVGNWRGQCIACALGIEAIDGSDLATVKALFAHLDNQQSWDDELDLLGDLAALAGLPRDYAEGLSDGWEGIRVGSQDEEYLQGYADGKAGLQTCLAAGLL